MQPPVVPHKIENYQLDKNPNRCMMCHARENSNKNGWSWRRTNGLA